MPRHVPISSSELALGLNTKLRPDALPHGACQYGSRNFWMPRGNLAKVPGLRRVVGKRPDDHAYLLNGRDHYFGGWCAQGSVVALQQANWTVEFVFRTDSMRDYQVLLYKGVGQAAFPTTPTLVAAASTDWMFWLQSAGTLMNVKFLASDGAATQTVPNIGTATNVIPGRYYHVIVTYDGTNYVLYVHEVGSAVGAGTTNPTTRVPQNPATERRFLFGAMPDSNAVYIDKAVQGLLDGVVQEVRIWNDVRTTQELEDFDDVQIDVSGGAPAGLVAYYPLTGLGTETYSFESAVGTVGTASGQVPRVYLMPRDISIAKDTSVFGQPLVGTRSAAFDGYTQGLEVRDSYIYRRPEVNASGVLRHPDKLIFAARVTPERLRSRDVLWMWTNTQGDVFEDTTYTGVIPTVAATVNAAAATESILELDIVDPTGAGTFNFMAVVWLNQTVAGVTTRRTWAVTTNVASGLVLGTTYNVSVYLDMSNAQSPALTVTVYDAFGTILSGAGAVITALVAPDFYEVPGSLDTFPGLKRKYAMSLGRCIARTRSLATDTDPNGIDIEYDFARSFRGRMDQVVLLTDPANTGAFGSTLLNVNRLQALLAANELTSDNVFSLPGAVQSAWGFDLGKSGSFDDIGFQGNPLLYRNDPGHLWARSGVTTLVKAKLVGLFEHHYVALDGTSVVTELVAVAGGTVYRIGQNVGNPLQPIDDGFRNDEGNDVIDVPFQDGTLLFCGGPIGNFHLAKDRLFRLSIEPPAGAVAVGLANQGNPDAKLTPGIRRYAIAFFSAITGKWSEAGIFLDVEIKRGANASVVFGDSAEIHQRYPTTGVSFNKAPFDLTGATASSPNLTQLRACAWYGSAAAKAATDPDWWESQPASGGDNEAKRKKIRFENDASASKANDVRGWHTLIDKSNDEYLEAPASKVKAIIEQQYERVHAIEYADGTVEMRGNFAGGGAHLEASNLAASGKEMIDGQGAGASAVLGFIASAGSGPLQTIGSGTTGHAMGLPMSGDRQVTHIGFFRTVVGSSTFRLVERVPLGTRSFEDNVPDEELVGEILDVERGSAPPMRFAVDFAGSIVGSGDTENPATIHFSVPGEPWNFRPQDQIEVLDGTSIEVTGLARTEDVLTVFKDQTMIVLTRTGNRALPFRLETRMRDIGTNSHLSIANARGEFFFPDRRGMYRYDSSNLEYVSRAIEGSWHQYGDANLQLATQPPYIDPDLFGQVAGGYDRLHRCLMWLVPSGDSERIGGGVISDRMLLFFPWIGEQGGFRYGWSVVDGLYFDRIVRVSSDKVYLLNRDGFVCEWANPLSGNSNFSGIALDAQIHPALSSISPDASHIVVPQLVDGAFPEGYLGCPVTVVNGATGVRETRYVVADDLASPDSTLTLDHALTWIPDPANGDTVIFGSIEFEWISGEMSPFGEDLVTQLLQVYVEQTPMANGGLTGTFQFLHRGSRGLLAAGGVGTETEATLSNDKVDTLVPIKAGGYGRDHRLRFIALDADLPVELRSLVLIFADAAAPGASRTSGGV